MSDDYSLVGYESVNVAEYLPILEKILADLNITYDSGLKKLPTRNISMSISDPLHSLSIPNLEPETQPQNKTSAINNPPYDSSTNTNYWDSQYDGSHAGAMNSQSVAGDSNLMDYLREDNKMLKEELLAKNKKIEQMKDELSRCHETIESLETKYVNFREKAKEHDLAIKQIQNMQAEIDKLKNLLNAKDQHNTSGRASTSQGRSEHDLSNKQIQNTIPKQIHEGINHFKALFNSKGSTAYIETTQYTPRERSDVKSSH